MPSLLAAPSLGLLLLALVVAAIVALHRLKPRPVTQVVASTWLWNAAARRVGIRKSSWRWWLALALSIAIGALLTVTLIRPEVQEAGDGSTRVLVLVDNGPTMAVRTRDGTTRWAHAVARARGVIRDAAGPVMVLDTAGRVAVSGFGDRRAALAALDRMTVVAAEVTLAPPLPEGPGLEVHFIGDGVTPPALPPQTIVHSVFEPADNVAVIRLIARPWPADPLRVEAFVQVLNASPVAKSVRLTLRGGERYSVSQNLQMAPGEIVDATFDVSAFEGGVLAAAALTSGDSFARDDIAYTVVGQHRVKRVLLVTRGNPALADALAALPGVRVETIEPVRYRHGAGADAYVFDEFAPRQPPAAGALLFAPTAADWLPGGDRGRGAVVVDDWERTSPVAAGVRWDALTFRHATLWQRLPDSAEAVVRADGGALVVSGRTGVPWTATGFRLGDTDLPLQPGFTIFLGNALARVMQTNATSSEPLGPIRVALVDAEVRDGHGREVESRGVPGATIFEADRPDIYTASAAGARVQVAAGVLDPRLADVNRSRFAEASVVGAAATTLPLERWVWIVLACIVLLLLDWAAYTRRLTR